MLSNQAKILAQQLRTPKGKEGIAVGESMFQTNLSMIRHAVHHLDIQPKDSLLEIGHGNGRHVSEVLQSTPQFHYTGLEISPIMHQQAEQHNSIWIENQQASFHLYDGKTLPFDSANFDKIFTVNTIYFWDQPLMFLKEMHRVLKQHGRLCITYGTKEYLEKMPFSQYEFQLYSPQEFDDLIDRAGFKKIEQHLVNERVPSKTHDGHIDRTFATSILMKV